MKRIKAKEAIKFLSDNPQAVLVDCRSEMEYLFVGHPVGAHHVAWNDGPDWDINPHFVGQVRKIASMNRPVVVDLPQRPALGQRRPGARAGRVQRGVQRSSRASKVRSTTVIIAMTISGWRKEGLPWEQS